MKKSLLLLASALLYAASAQATSITYITTLSGPGEAPPNASPGTGTARVIIDTVLNTMQVDITFSGLLGTTTASHIHCCTPTPNTGTAIVATTTPNFTGFPLGVQAGSYSHLFDLTLASSYNPAFITAHGGTVAGAETALLAAMAEQETYLNIHSSIFGGGEIRGFLAEAVPEPASLLLLGTGLIGAGLRYRRRRR